MAGRTLLTFSRAAKSRSREFDAVNYVASLICLPLPYALPQAKGYDTPDRSPRFGATLAVSVRAGSGFRLSIWNSLALDPVIIGSLQLGAARCCAYRGRRPVAGRRPEFRLSTAASRWRHLCGGRLGVGLSGPARRVAPTPKG
jgi:hypothetical protein